MRNTTINTRPIIIVSAAFVAALTGCSSSGTSPQPVTKVNPLQGKLQVAVGTANIFGDVAAASATGLNVVATFRQVAGQQTIGDSEALVSTPSISGPMKLPTLVGTADPYGATIATGVSGSESGGSAITATPQQVAGSTSIPPSTFGVSNGVFSSGIEPFNATVVGGAGQVPAGQPVSFTPNTVPAYDPVASDPNAFVPFGGPPAFDPNKTGRGTRDGQGEPRGVLGTEEGLDVFQGVAPSPGTYSLNVVVPTSQSSNGTLTASAILSSTALLAAIAPPATVTTDGNGGANFAVTLPPGVTEAYAQITDIGPTTMGAVSCNGSGTGASGAPSPAYYTILATASGTLTLGPGLGPVGKPSQTNPSLCTSAQNTAASQAAAVAAGSTFTGTSDGDQFTVQLVGFDYPAFESSAVNQLGNSAPVLTGSNGQSDITVSSAILFMQAAGSPGAQTLGRLQRSASDSVLRAVAAKRLSGSRHRH